MKLIKIWQTMSTTLGIREHVKTILLNLRDRKMNITVKQLLAYALHPKYRGKSLDAADRKKTEKAL